MGEDRLRGRVHAGAIGGDRIEGAAATQAFDLSAVEVARIDPIGEVVERLEGTLGAALFDQLFHRLLADALEGAAGVADGVALSRPLDRAPGLAGVAAGRPDVDSQPAHVLE